MGFVKTVVALTVAIVAAMLYLAETPEVRAWQQRMANRLECALVVTAARDDLVPGYCSGPDVRKSRVGDQ